MGGPLASQEIVRAQAKEVLRLRTEFPGTLGSVDRSAVELARESGTRTAAEQCQAPHQRLCRADRLSRRTWPGQERDPCTGARISLGRDARKCVRARTNRCGQEFGGLRPGSEGVPRRLLSPVHSRPVRDLAMARADGSLRRLLARIARIDVLVIDDWAMSSLSEPERRDFWVICEHRYQVRSTILTSQLPVSRWHEQFGDPTLADGISSSTNEPAGKVMPRRAWTNHDVERDIPHKDR